MNTTQPIRDCEQLEHFKNYYKDINLRNYTLIILGLNTALRISDILNLTLENVFNQDSVRRHIIIRERKTGKENCILLNDTVRRLLSLYYKELKKTNSFQKGNPYLFPSPRSNEKPLSRFQAYRIIRSAADAIGIEDTISCHSMRKTFGYHAWKQGRDPLVIMIIFNHSSLSVTKRYLCLEQDDKDAVYRNTVL
ncbi:MAG: site-specific integrase [Roseburia sp.]|nr:site-specific integrase [Roseburia sp.]